LSRDGGFIWTEVGTGYWHFQFAAQGSIVAAVRKYRYVNTLQWSCNEGLDWNTVHFLGNANASAVSVIGMLTEPGERALHVT